ncbi:MAG: hypothetical protein M1812_006555 [Candelaria pacifica]|nr:MAG: hypothetical protein M1812_006555 [Candelaria pacifica]
MGLIAGIFFTFWRILQILTLIPTLGMLAYFVHGFVSTNTLTPDSILVLFITSVLAAVWCIITLFAYHRTRHSAFFVSLIDLAFIGTFIGAVYALRGIAKADCSNFSSGGIYLNLGPFGYYARDSGTQWSLNINKTCAMLKACFAFGIMNCIMFAITSFQEMREITSSEIQGLYAGIVTAAVLAIVIRIHDHNMEEEEAVAGPMYNDV